MTPTKIINNKPINILNYLKLVWLNRTLIGMFFYRDVKIKYSQTKLKVAWIVLQPVMMMLLFSFFFGFILKWSTFGIPYPIYVFSGLIIWNLFQNIVQASIPVYFDNSSLIKHNNFPKITLVIAKIFSTLVDAILSIFLLIVLMMFFSILPSWKIILLFIPILITIALGLSVALLTISISFKKRDFLFAIPHLLSVMIWITPIFFSVNILPHNIKLLIYLNPLAGLVDLWRACLFETAKFDFSYLPILFLTIPVLLFSFIFYCRKESYFVDNL